jgi:Iap family predicted aminopeptidase
VARDPKIQVHLDRIDADRLAAHVRHLACDPLPYRKLNHTRPGCARSTLDEADDYVMARLEAWGYSVEREPVPVQAFRCDASKPKAHQYSAPDPSDPWYTAHNLYATRAGGEGIIVICAHKDSPSWVDSPGAYDNAVGTAAALEIARVLAEADPRHTVRFLFCNEEHTPWTSVTAAQRARERGDRIAAVFNLDGLGGKAQEDLDAGRRTNVTGYTASEGRVLADLMAAVNDAYGLGLVQRSFAREAPGDDDGSFVKAGFPAAVINVGSMPYADPHYHAEGDTAEHVDAANVALATRATLAAVLTLARGAR